MFILCHFDRSGWSEGGEDCPDGLRLFFVFEQGWRRQIGGQHVLSNLREQIHVQLDVAHGVGTAQSGVFSGTETVVGQWLVADADRCAAQFVRDLSDARHFRCASSIFILIVRHDPHAWRGCHPRRPRHRT